MSKGWAEMPGGALLASAIADAFGRAADADTGDCTTSGGHYWVDTGTNLVCDYCGA